MSARSVLALGVLLVAGFAEAQEPEGLNTDYYSGVAQGSAQKYSELIGAVERYHLALCMRGDPSQSSKAFHYKTMLSNCIFILNYFPNHPQALLHIAQVCEVWQDPQCDLPAFFEKAINVNPNVADTYTVIGISQLRTKKVSPAIASLEQALKLNPASFNAHYNLALAYFETKQFDLSNQHAQLAYQFGAPFPGLRNKLKRGGYWKPQEVPSAAPPSGSTARE